MARACDYELGKARLTVRSCIEKELVAVFTIIDAA
jgi:hypothetical protein